MIFLCGYIIGTFQFFIIFDNIQHFLKIIYILCVCACIAYIIFFYGNQYLFPKWIQERHPLYIWYENLVLKISPDIQMFTFVKFYFKIPGISENSQGWNWPKWLSEFKWIPMMESSKSILRVREPSQLSSGLIASRSCSPTV